MQLDTLKLILKTHKRNPWQQLYTFDYRSGPDNIVTIYDMDYPRRLQITEDRRVGYEESDWWHNASICNVPTDYIPRISQASRKTGNILRKGYIEILKALLGHGCIVPSTCLDEWLGPELASRKLCSPELRINYRNI